MYTEHTELCRHVTSSVGVVSGVLPVHLVLRAVAVFIWMNHPVVLKGDGHWTQTWEHRPSLPWNSSDQSCHTLFSTLLHSFISCDTGALLLFYLCCLCWTSSPPGGADRRTRGRTASAASGRASGHWWCHKRRLTTRDLPRGWETERAGVQEGATAKQSQALKEDWFLRQGAMILISVDFQFN